MKYFVIMKRESPDEFFNFEQEAGTTNCLTETYIFKSSKKAIKYLRENKLSEFEVSTFDFEPYNELENEVSELELKY